MAEPHEEQNERLLCEQFMILLASFEMATSAQLELFRATVSPQEFARAYPFGPAVDLRADNVNVLYERVCALVEKPKDDEATRKKILPVVGTIVQMWQMQPKYGLVTGPAMLERVFAQAKVRGCKKVVALLKSKAAEIAWQTDDGKPSTKWEDYNWDVTTEMPSQWDRHAHAVQMIGTGNAIGITAPPIPIVYRWERQKRGDDGYSFDTIFDRRTKASRGTTFEQSRIKTTLPAWVIRSRQWTQILLNDLPQRGCLPTDKYTVYAAFVRDPDAPEQHRVQAYIGSTTKTPNERWIRHVEMINGALKCNTQNALFAELVMARAFMESETRKSWDDIAVVVCLASFRPVNASKEIVQKAKDGAKQLETRLIESMKTRHADTGLNSRL